VRLREEVDDDTDYFQAVYDDEINIAQTQRIANLLGVHGQAPTAAVPRETAKTSTFSDAEESGMVMDTTRAPRDVDDGSTK
jgi:hypothetical protein